jgi:FkbM family methyltransferase
MENSMLTKFLYRDKLIKILGHKQLEVITHHIMHTQTFFEEPYLAAIVKKYPEQKVVLDIGANIGNHSLYFSHFFTYEHLHAFEPQPDNVALLKQNLARFPGKTTVHPIGLSSESKIIRLRTQDPQNYGGFITETEHILDITMPTKHEVQFETLDSFNLNDVTFIKMDVEGHELPILEGARDTIARNKPIISLENLHHAAPTQIPRDQHYAFFESIDYILEEENVGGYYMDTWLPR